MKTFLPGCSAVKASYRNETTTLTNKDLSLYTHDMIRVLRQGQYIHIRSVNQVKVSQIAFRINETVTTAPFLQISFFITTEMSISGFTHLYV